MVQSIDNNLPNYNAVKINIRKPEINASGLNSNSVVTNNGVYNAVNIDIDNPTVNTEPEKVYDYPEADSIVTYEQANIRPVPLPRGFHLAYQTTNVILPKMENEIEMETPKTGEKEPDNRAADTPEVPEPAYTTVEAEKGEDNIENDVKIMEAEESPEAEKTEETKETAELKRPEIIPGEEIKPEVDIPLVVSNLSNEDFDVQAQQMEEIARISLDNPENAVPYIVREVFAGLIDITKKDTTGLAAPTDEQIEARKKMIANYVATETSHNSQGPTKLPYRLTENDIALANEISPMEQAERNKEYALYTIAILAKVYTDEVEKQTGNIVPMTDIPGTSAIVDALRYNPNSGVKIAAIDALKHIQRPEYKEELTTLYTLAQADTNPQVAANAARALEKIDKQ